MIATFAYNKNGSPLNNITGAKIIRHKPAQYMSLCHFNNVYWAFDREKNYAPHLIFEGEVECLDAIDTKFPNNVDAVMFNQNKPTVRFDYTLDEEQLSELAKKGFWGETGVNIPSLFTTSKFQLETYATVEEIVTDKSKDNTPIFNIELTNPYGNTFDVSAYELVNNLTRRKAEETKTIESSIQFAAQPEFTPDVESAKVMQNAPQAGFDSYSIEEIELRTKSASIDDLVNAERNALETARKEGNARAIAELEAENKRILTAEMALADAVSEILNNKSPHIEPESPDKNIENNNIFDSKSDSSDSMPDKAAEFMKRLSESKNETVKNDKNDDSSGSTSGTSGLGVYTFEDQDTAHFEMRADEGKGNEKPEEEEKEENESEDETESNPNAIDLSSRKARFASSIGETSRSALNAMEEDRSR